ncbi:CBS domain-containing protein [Actinomycetes bacterium KLBMP 9797]
MKKTTVGDVMTTNVATVQENTDYRSIVDLLVGRRISAVPVLDDTGRVIGVVSEADLLYKIEFAGAPEHRRIFPGRQRSDRDKGAGRVARDFMSAPAVTITADATVAEAARRMAERRVKRLPVVDGDGRLAGIVSRPDLLRVHLRPDAQLRRDIVDEVLSRTLWIEPGVVTVVVQDGVVALRGRLDRRSLAEMAARLTAAVPGVVRVDDELTYDLDDLNLDNSRWNRSHPFSTM